MKKEIIPTLVHTPIVKLHISDLKQLQILLEQCGFSGVLIKSGGEIFSFNEVEEFRKAKDVDYIKEFEIHSDSPHYLTVNFDSYRFGSNGVKIYLSENGVAETGIAEKIKFFLLKRKRNWFLRLVNNESGLTVAGFIWLFAFIGLSFFSHFPRPVYDRIFIYSIIIYIAIFVTFFFVKIVFSKNILFLYEKEDDFITYFKKNKNQIIFDMFKIVISAAIGFFLGYYLKK